MQKISYESDTKKKSFFVNEMDDDPIDDGYDDESFEGDEAPAQDGDGAEPEYYIDDDGEFVEADSEEEEEEEEYDEYDEYEEEEYDEKFGEEEYDEEEEEEEDYDDDDYYDDFDDYDNDDE